MRNYIRFITQIALVSVLAGCASVDWDYPKSESRALQDTQDTHLGQQVADDLAAHPGEAGFYPIVDGIDSLALRLLMAERAERSIDAQYFLIHNDIVGKVFVAALLEAADRGVRVRFLLDDILSQGLDPGLAALDSHENIEVRIFNPFAHRKARAMDVGQLGRISRRMHNKSFTVDNQVTLLGGRNIAAEYFDARPDVKFGDIDVLAIGAIVPEVSDMFDTYWNHRAAIPMPALTDVPDNTAEALARLNDDIMEALEDIPMSKYAAAVDMSVLNYVETNTEVFTWSDYDLVFDSPDKSSAKTVNEDELITVKMKESLGSIDESLFVVTPYFVLRDEDVEWFGSLRARGVDVKVLTNSLAANNHTAVHSAYYPTRKRLLKMGVKLYELRASHNKPVDEKITKEDPISTLHAKVFSVDGKSLFIGSFNWNQRSINRDTELGVIIHSPSLVAEFVGLVSAWIPEASFELSLDDSNNVLWTTVEDGQEVVATKEPQTGAWKRFGAWFQRIVPKSQL